MTLIAMAVFDTVENKRSEFTKKALASVSETVDLHKHRFFIIDNASCEESKAIINSFKNANNCQIITNATNVGVAKAINLAWKLRNPEEHLIKIDNDVVIHSDTWVEQLEEAIERDPEIGIIGLKRKDYPSQFAVRSLDHFKGQRWIVVEDAQEIIGTCKMTNYKLIDKIGGLCQPSIWGYEDILASLRCKLAGFKNCYLPTIDIDHIDSNDGAYRREKEAIGNAMIPEYQRLALGMTDGTIPLYIEM